MKTSDNLRVVTANWEVVNMQLSLWFYGTDSTNLSYTPKVRNSTWNGPFHLDQHYPAHYPHLPSLHTSSVALLQVISTDLTFLKSNSDNFIIICKYIHQKGARNEDKK